MSDLVENFLVLSSNINFFQETGSSESEHYVLDCLAQQILKTRGGNLNIKIEEFNRFDKFLSLLSYIRFSS
jgi:hypothetical protein